MTKCMNLTPEELEVTFFGQGKNQQLKAIELCKDCPLKAQCLDIAMQQGDAWGVFGGHAFRDGEIVR